MMKLFLSVVLAFVGVGNFASAAQVVVPEIDWETVELDDTHVQIYRENQIHDIAAIPVETAGDLVIPREIRGCVVSSIGPKAFYNCSNLTSVVISEGVTNIADEAFLGCTSLTNIVIPASMRTIGKEVFAKHSTEYRSYEESKCLNLSSVDVRSLQLAIGDYAFLNLPALREVRFVKGDSLTLGESVFARCSNLADFTLDVKDVDLGFASFYACERLADMLITAKNLKIGQSVFSGSDKLASVSVSAESVDIGRYAWSTCSGLTNLCILADNIGIGLSAFSSCSKLASIHLTAKSLHLGDSAFSDCSRLIDLSLSSGEISLGNSAFIGCSALESAFFTAESFTAGGAAFSHCSGLTDFCVVSTNATLGASAFADCSSLASVSLAANSLAVNESAFSGCSELTNLYAIADDIKIGSSSFSKCSRLPFAMVSAETLEVGASAFSDCENMTNAVFAASIRATIGEQAFVGCNRLETLQLPSVLQIISRETFKGCKGLRDISLPTNLASIAYSAFDDCSGLRTVEFPESLRDIDSYAFYDCKNLVSLTFPQSLESIGSNAFEKCSALIRVDFPHEIMTNAYSAASVRMAPSAFYKCVNLSHVVLSQRQTEIPSKSFASCINLVDLIVSSNLTAIAETAFEGCSSLTSVQLPPSLAAIGRKAFYNCSSLTGFSIPTNGVVALGSEAFKNTKYWDDWANDSLVVNNTYILGFKGNPTHVALPDGCVEISDRMFTGMTALKSVAIPSTVKKVGTKAFAGSGIERISLAGVSSIGVSAFEGCSNLVAVTALSDALKEISANAFMSCVSLTSINIPAGVTKISENAFHDCTSLRTVTGCEGVVWVGDFAFAGDTELKSFRIPNEVTYGLHVLQGVQWTENVLFPLVGTLKDEYPESYTQIVSVVFSSGTTSIVERACAGCRALETIEIPLGVKSIGEEAFAGCEALSSVSIPTSVTTVGTNAFERCSSVASVSFPNRWAVKTLFPDSVPYVSDVTIVGVFTAILNNFLSGCSSITNFTIPSTVTRIGIRSFADCTGLVMDLDIPDSVTTIGNEAFMNCQGLKSVSIPTSVTTVGSNAFARCSSVRSTHLSGAQSVRYLFPDSYSEIASITVSDATQELCEDFMSGCSSVANFSIPPTLTKIGARAFADCTGLALDLTIPDGVTAIGNEAFRNCRALHSVVMTSSVDTVGTDAFQGCSSVSSVQLSGGQSMRSLFPDRYRQIVSIAVAADADALCDGFLEGCESVTTFDIPLSVTSIGARAFAGCTGLDFSIEIPEGVTSVGDEAFANCTGLKTVRFLGPKPTTVGKDIYKGTTGDFVTGVLKANKSSWVSGEKLPTYWPEKDDYRRKIGWWVGAQMATVYFSCWPNCADNKAVQVIADGRREIGEDQAPDVPDREGYECNGIWYTAAEGGSPVEFPLTVTKSMSLYLHWVKEGEIDPDDPDADVPEAEYDFSKAHVFYGAVKSGDAVVGSFELKAAKGKVNRQEETITVKLTATVNLLREGKLTFKGEMDDGLSGVLVSSKRGDEREIAVDFDLGEPIIRVLGDFDGYELVGSQDVFAGESPAARAVAKQVKSRVSAPCAIAFVTSGGETVEMGSAFGLTAKADSKGKMKVSGVLPDGKKLSTQGMLYWTPEGMVCPVVAPMYNKKQGGLAFSVEFLPEDELAVTGCGPWIIAGKEIEEVEIESALVSPVAPLAEESVVSCDALDEWEDQPEIVLGGKKWRFPKNPAGLNLSWTSSTGLFKGSFKVPVETESGRVKKVAATVNGAVVNGVGYGHALIKGVGTIPLTIGD